MRCKHFKNIRRRLVLIISISAATLTSIVLPFIGFTIIGLVWLCVYIGI
nr:MAG TPA: PHOTOSYSTEM I SUBUNIT PSAA, PHOTOSYSTEM PROTEIN, MULTIPROTEIN-PIGMENT COMPLEX, PHOTOSYNTHESIS [Caudoviricetes sp.]